MNIPRLQRLSQFLRTQVSVDQFYFPAYWCGTYGCALGWACHIPEFITDGLYLDGITPVFKDNSELMAAKEFFELTFEQATVIFIRGALQFSPNLITPKHIADRIDALITTEEYRKVINRTALTMIQVTREGVMA